VTRGAEDPQVLVTQVLSSCPELPLPDGLAERIADRLDREESPRPQPPAARARHARRRTSQKKTRAPLV
jgi:hypothetical protein